MVLTILMSCFLPELSCVADLQASVDRLLLTVCTLRHTVCKRVIVSSGTVQDDTE